MIGLCTRYVMLWKRLTSSDGDEQEGNTMMSSLIKYQLRPILLNYSQITFAVSDAELQEFQSLNSNLRITLSCTSISLVDSVS